MRKVAIIIALLLLGGTGVYLATRHKTPSPVVQTSTSTFSSIQDALNRSLSLKCDYMYKDIHTVAHIKNGQIRSDIMSATDPSVAGSVIIKINEKKIFYWNAQGMGFMMDMPDVHVTPTGPAQGASSPAQNTISSLEQYKQNCKEAQVADSLFLLPTNITFKSASQMMPTIPTGTMPTSGYAVPTQYQRYMPY